MSVAEQKPTTTERRQSRPHVDAVVSVELDEDMQADLEAQFEAVIGRLLSGDSHYHELAVRSVTLDVTDCKALPLEVRGTYHDPGLCDGEHRGPCQPYCEPWSLNWLAELDLDGSRQVGYRTIVRYDVGEDVF